MIRCPTVMIPIAASVWVLAAMGIITVAQRILHVRTELNAAGTVVNDL